MFYIKCTSKINVHVSNYLVKYKQSVFHSVRMLFQVNHYIVGYHDAFLIYGDTIKDMIIEGMDIFDGRQVTRRIWNKTYHNLISGNLRINDNGDAEKDLSIYDWDPNGKLSVWKITIIDNI